LGGRAAQPIALIKAKGKTHMSKAQMKEREEHEIKVDMTDVKPPAYLTAKQKRTFTEISGKLMKIGIMTELDEDTLARYLVAHDQYIQALRMYKSAVRANEGIDVLDKISRMQDRYAKQCRSMASDLGLTITSRAKLVVPKTEPPKENKFLAKFGGGSAG